MTVNFFSSPAAAMAALSRAARLALALTAISALPACSTAGDSAPTVTVGGLVQDLTLDPSGQTIVASLPGFEGALSTSSVEVSGLQTPTSVQMTGSTAVIAFDAVVSPDHQLRFIGVSGISNDWRSVSTSDARTTAFGIVSATQDTSDLLLGGDEISVQFYNGPRVVESSVADISNWTLSVGGTPLDLAGTSISLDSTTQLASITLGALASLHSSFTLSCDIATVAATSVTSMTLTGVAVGDAAPPTVVSVTQELDELSSGDEFGRVLVFDFDEPISPIFGAVPSSFSVVDHADAQGLTIPTNVESVASDDTQLRVTFSRPVVPALDEISLSGILDAHGNALTPVTSPITAGDQPVNHFSVVSFETVEGAGNDRVVASTTQALDPDTAADGARWALTVGGVGPVDLTGQSLAYDLLSKTLTIQLDFDVVNGTTGDLQAAGAVDVDGETFVEVAPTQLAAGDTDPPAVSSMTQNRVVDPTGQTLDITFTEDVEPVTATDVGSYVFSPALVVVGATVVNGTTVRVVTAATALPGDYTLTVAQAVSDPAGNDLGAPAGPTAFGSTDDAAPRPIAAAGTAIEGASNDRLTVLFDDDMVLAEVEDLANWAVESPVGTPLDLSGSTVTYFAAGSYAHLVLDAAGAESFIRGLEVGATLTGMRDLGGNTVTATPVTATVQGEKNRPAVESAFIVSSGPGDELTLRFSEPMRRLTDTYDSVSNPAGVRYAVVDPVTSMSTFPVAAAEVDGGLGVTLTFSGVIDPGVTVDVVGLVDLAGNVLFPVHGLALEVEAVGEPAVSAASFTAVAGTDNDQVVVTFAEPMSAWGILAAESYGMVDSLGGSVPELADAQFKFDGLDTVTITFGPGSGFNLDVAESYDLNLEVSPSVPLRTRSGVPFSGASATGLLGVGGDTLGVAPLQCRAIVDPVSTAHAYAVFDETVDESAALAPAHYSYQSGTLATSVTLVGDRVVRVHFDGTALAPGGVIEVDAAMLDTAGNAPQGVIQLSLTTDLQAPTLLGSTCVIVPGMGGDYIDLSFDEALDPVMASQASNYAISSGGSGLRLLGVFPLGETGGVRLLVEDLLEGATVTVTIDLLADVVGNVRSTLAASSAVATGDAVAPTLDSGVVHRWWDATGRTVDVRFSEDIDYTFAQAPTNWSTSGVATVLSAVPISADHVRLTLSDALGANETVDLLAGLLDSAGNLAGPLSLDPSD